jgi:chlorobactene glucosyltransferase
MGVIVGVLIIMLLLLIINLLTFYRLSATPQHERHDTSSKAHAPLVSILIPARDEEHCIEMCVRSLLAQHYEPLEILVLDDQSSDATAQIVQTIIDELPCNQQARLRLLKGETLPVGWIGKNFACQQLARHARGEHLLFTDADTIHEAGMVGAVIDCMQIYNVALLTAQPEHVLGSLGESLIVPLLNFTIMTLLPIALIRRRPEASLATGNGQLLCFQRTVYESVGGHAAVKGRILEDVLLARATKAAGYHMMFVDAQYVLRCRMYRSFSEVWSGFSKNLYAFYNHALPFALLGLLLNLALFVTPLLLLILAAFTPLPLMVTLFALIAYLLAVLMRLLLTLRFIRTQRLLSIVLCLLHPISIALECLILLNSMHWYYRKRGTLWKGRAYQGI